MTKMYTITPNQVKYVRTQQTLNSVHTYYSFTKLYTVLSDMHVHTQRIPRSAQHAQLRQLSSISETELQDCLLSTQSCSYHTLLLSPSQQRYYLVTRENTALLSHKNTPFTCENIQEVRLKVLEFRDLFLTPDSQTCNIYIKLIDSYNIPYPSSVRPKQPTSSNVSIPLRSLL